MSQEIKWKRTVEPASEPITATQVKKQLEIASSDTTHDDQITLLIGVARDQVEHDTGLALMTQTIVQYYDDFDEELYLARRPVQSISSIQYYDSSNTLQTLDSSVYSLNDLDNEVELAYDQVWPSTVDRWDAVKVTYVAGFASAALVPTKLKQSMLLLVGYYFENRDMLVNEATYDRTAYEALVRRHARYNYP